MVVKIKDVFYEEGTILIETQKLKLLKLWLEEPTSFRGGEGNVSLGNLYNAGLRGEIQVDVIRSKATKVLGKEIDLTSSQVLSVDTLPDDIKNELKAIFNKIEKLL